MEGCNIAHKRKRDESDECRLDRSIRKAFEVEESSPSGFSVYFSNEEYHAAATFVEALAIVVGHLAGLDDVHKMSDEDAEDWVKQHVTMSGTTKDHVLNHYMSRDLLVIFHDVFIRKGSGPIYFGEFHDLCGHIHDLENNVSWNLDWKFLHALGDDAVNKVWDAIVIISMNEEREIKHTKREGHPRCDSQVDNTQHGSHLLVPH